MFCILQAAKLPKFKMTTSTALLVIGTLYVALVTCNDMVPQVQGYSDNIDDRPNEENMENMLTEMYLDDLMKNGNADEYGENLFIRISLILARQYSMSLAYP